jgi:pyruvate dehydrogenase E2 component (dihydrolipoamide acetyltransferase)
LVPEVRSEWDPKNDRIRVFASTDVAYLTSCCESTVAPVIFGVENMKLSQIADTLGEFGQLAKNHKLETDVGHGTIGVISLADSGVRQFSSIVRAPQTCVVCIGAPIKELVTKSTGEAKPQQSATATSSQSKDETKPKVEKTEQKKPETQPAKPVADVSVKPAADSKEPQYSAATFINITLSCDHRIVDGAVGSQFLTHLKAFVENPIKLLI